MTYDIMVTWQNLGTVNTLSYLFDTLRQPTVWSRHGYLGSITSRQNTNHASTKLTWYAAGAYQKKQRLGIMNVLFFFCHIIPYSFFYLSDNHLLLCYLWFGKLN